MRAVIQRVNNARVTVAGEVIGEIGSGLLVLLRIADGDTERDAEYVLDKTVNLRIFEDDDGKMNLSLLDVKGELLVVSQFTLYGDTRRGRRPSFIEAAAPEKADELYKFFVERAGKAVTKVATGKFQSMMNVELVNSGPVTIILDSSKTF
ncbi:MAG: D-aminoacyl-tRNA deacylase [Acidobacteriota bacterium]